MSIFKKLPKRPAVTIPAILILAGALAYFFIQRENPPAETIAVTRGTIVQEVSVTGKTKPAENVSLAFEKSGKIARVDAKVGDRVSAGETLAALDTAEILADLRQAEASVEAQKAELDELKRGTRPEEIRVQEVKVGNAEAAFEDAARNLVDKLQDAYTKSDDAVRAKTDQLFSNPRSSNPQVNFSLDDAGLKSNLERERFALESTLVSWKSSLDTVTPAGDLPPYLSAAKLNLERVKSLLDKSALALASLGSSTTISQTTIDGYKSDVSTARTNINTAANNLSAAEEKMRTGQSNLLLAENELILKEAGATPEQIAAQAAELKQAEAKVAAVQAQIAKSVLRSPINGTVAKQDAKAGEIAAPNVVLVAVISESNLEIEVNVPEVDIGKIQRANPVRITLDAFPGENFTGRVSYIDPAETIVDGVVNFKVTVLFDQADSRFKSGLTANLDIETHKKENVLILPQFTIIENDEGTFVRKIDGNDTREVAVKIGVRGQDGNAEILEGLGKGDRVLNVGFKANGK